jgi:type I restriction enzyme S subunit
LGEISDYGKCVTVPVSAIQDDEWVLELEDIEKDTGRILKQITKKERPINGSRHAFTKNQILYSKLRTYLNKVLIAPNNGYCTTEIIPISPQSGILPEYLNLVLRSPYFQEYTAQCGYGVKMPRLGTSDAIKSLIPVPPYGEQQRIIESANKLADITERIQSEKEHLSEHITGCKSRILELAIYGKLVPQDPAEEPAIELLKRIKPDFTPSHNLHYADLLPTGWVVCSLNEACEILDSRRQPINSKEREKRAEKANNLFPYYGATGQVGVIDNYILDGEYLLLGEDGAPFLDRYAKKAYVVSGKIWVNNHAHILRPRINSTYMMYYLNVIDYRPYVTGTTRLKLTQEVMKNMPVLVPPLAEQDRIISRIQQLFSVIDTIQLS